VALAVQQAPVAVASNGASNGSSTGSSHGTPLLILYGSNSGTCEALAGQLADAAAAAGFGVTSAPLDTRVGDLPKTGGLVVLSSTYNGFPPDNAKQFAAWLVQQAAEGGQGAAGVSYAVFGVGNSQWATYQAFPK
jgi:cytochrome P450/NADPH-cytochrome P450 reductase